MFVDRTEKPAPAINVEYETEMFLCIVEMLTITRVEYILQKKYTM